MVTTPSPHPTPTVAPAAALSKEVAAADVVAAGAEPRLLQLPSPVYLAEWLSPTHVVVGAGGGGSRFGMANVLVLLEVRTERTSGTAPGPSPGAGPTLKLSEAQQAAVGGAGGGLWRFVAALDLGRDVPWCTSRFLRMDADYDDKDKDSEDDEAGAGRLARGSSGGGGGGGAAGGVDDGAAATTARARFRLSPGQRETLRDAVGLLAVSSIKTVTLVAVERAGKDYRLRRLARVVVPNDPHNPDKKPVALIRNALVVAHDAKGVFLYDLGDLVPEAGAAETLQAAPLAEWPLPARVNDLHANRVNLVQAAASRDGVRARLFDFVIVAAAVQDKTVRLASFRLRRDYGVLRARTEDTDPSEVAEGAVSSSPPLSAPAPVRPSASTAAPVQDLTQAPLQFLPGEVLTAEAMGLVFRPLASSFRLVRLFGLEDLAGWPGAVASARRRMTNHSLSSSPGEAAPAPPLPAASLLISAFDADGNRNFLVARTLHTALTRLETVPWRLSSVGAVEADRPPPRRPRRDGQLALTWTSTPTAGPSAVVGDCITCLSESHEVADTAAREAAMRRNPFGAAVPLGWVAGTVDGLLVRVLASELAAGHTTPPPPPPGRPSRTAVALPALPAGRIAFVGVHTRPVVAGPARVRRAFGALHKEPVTAVAVSAENDVLSTDLAQNVAISTLPFTLVPAKTAAAAPRHGGDRGEVVQPAVTKQKVPGLELFPPTVGTGGVGALGRLLSAGPQSQVQLLGLGIVFSSLLLLAVFLLLL